VVIHSAPDNQAAAVSAAPAAAGPIAIVSLDDNGGNGAPTVTGALEVTKGKAVIAASGAVNGGDRTTEVTFLPHRGVLRVCASTTVKLASDTSVPAGGCAGADDGRLIMGRLRRAFATGRNSRTL